MRLEETRSRGFELNLFLFRLAQALAGQLSYWPTESVYSFSKNAALRDIYKNASWRRIPPANEDYFSAFTVTAIVTSVPLKATVTSKSPTALI